MQTCIACTQMQGHEISKNLQHNNNDHDQCFRDFALATFAVAGAVEGWNEAVHGCVPAL